MKNIPYFLTGFGSKSAYIAVDQKRGQIITISWKDITQFLHANEHLLLCSINLPIYDMKTTQSSWEAQIISKKTVARWCQIATFNGKNYITGVPSYSPVESEECEECHTSTFCPAEEVTSQVLRNTGIVTIPDGCMLQGKDHVIQSHSNFYNEVGTYYTRGTRIVRSSVRNQQIPLCQQHNWPEL